MSRLASSLLSSVTKPSKARRAAVIGAGLVASLGISMGMASASGGTHWSYEGATGPDHWGSLDPTYAACSAGEKQSPINIDVKQTTAKHYPNPIFNYGVSQASLIDNGHSIDVSPIARNNPSTMTLNDKEYKLVQFHFHAPSEHTINGKHFPLEIHFVNKSADGTLAVIGVMVKEGPAARRGWPQVVHNLNVARTDSLAETVLPFSWNRLLPADLQTFRYSGSLTTPPCTEGVKWNIIQTPMTMSPMQIKAFQNAYDGHNRPLQPLNGRVVYRDSSAN